MQTDLADVVQDLRRDRRRASEALRRAEEAHNALAIATARRELLRAADALLWASWGEV
jgi:hypothetical protein